MVKANTNDLMQASMKIGEAMYKAQAEDEAAKADAEKDMAKERRGEAQGRRHRRRLQGSEGRQEEERVMLGFIG